MILPRPEAPLGSVAPLSLYNPTDFTPTSAILCRNTAPLIGFAFELLARGVACHVVGKEIEIGLQILLDKVNVGGNKNETQIKLRAHCEKEVSRLKLKGKKEAAANFQDKCTALSVIIGGCDGLSGIEGVKQKLHSLFASGSGVTLSTIHKAKGLEWETVFLLDWNLLPSRYAESDAAKTQERNLQYVAVTRAKLDLRFIESGCWR